MSFTLCVSLSCTNKFLSTSLRQIDRSGRVTLWPGKMREEQRKKCNGKSNEFATRRRWKIHDGGNTKTRYVIRKIVSRIGHFLSRITQLERLFNTLVSRSNSFSLFPELPSSRRYHLSTYFHGASSEGAAVSRREGAGAEKTR